MKYNVDELFDIATRTFIGLGYDVTEGSNSKTDYGHSRYFYVNQDNKADVNSGLGFQVRVSDHSTGDRRILNGEQFIFDNKDVMEVFNRINYWFHPEEYKNVVVVKTKVVQIEVGENDLQPSDEIISERVAKSGSKRYTIKRTYKNEGVVPTHKFSGYKLPFKPNNPDFRFAEGGKTKRYMKKIKRGGITYGKSHAEGGIPVKNQSTGDMLEVEGGEGIVNKRSMASDKKVKLNGKEMTICEAVSQLNQLEGGVQFSCDDVEDRQFIEAMAQGGELERGVRTEQEHIQVLKDLYAKRITPKQASKRIAKDHLKEDSQYYSKLAKMEGKMANGGMSDDLSMYIDYDKTKLGEYEKVENMSTLNSLKKNGFIEFTYNTGKDKIKIDRPSSKGIYVERNTYKNREIESAVKPKFTFKGKDFFIGYQKGVNYLEFYVLTKGEDWGKYNSEGKMAKGGEIFDKETEDYLSELTKKFAKGGEVVADKTETINMKDFEGYADQYNGRKNKFFKATDEYQLLVNEGMDVKNNKDLPQEEKDKLLAELREKAREAKNKLNEERKDFVDMREIKSPFYAPQLADGGKISKADAKAIDRGDGGTYKIKLKHPFFPSKGVDVYLYIDSLSMLGTMQFTLGVRNLDFQNPKQVISDILEKKRLSPSSYQIDVTKEAKSVKVKILFNFPITSDNFTYLSKEILKALTNKEYYQSILDGKEEERTTTPPTEKEEDWNWRFKTEEELKEELGGNIHALKEGEVFGKEMIYLLGKKIKETNDSVDALFKINHKDWGGVEVDTKEVFGISNPERHNQWSISSWMITDKPLEGEEVPPTEKKKEITEKDVQNEVFRWTEEKVKEKKDINERKYQTSNLIDWILLNQNGGSMVQFSELIATAKLTEKVFREMGRLSNEGLPVDGFVMQLMYKKVLQLVEDIKAQIMLFVLFESEVKQELDILVFHIKYLAELDTFDKEYILHIK